MYQFFFYLDQRLTKKKEIPKSLVISVGNLSVGGTGKTPFTIYLIEFLRQATELPLCVLSRGYLGRNSKTGMKVEINSDPKLSGDEPLLIKKTHPDVEVIIGKNRYKSFLKHSNLVNKEKIILLDDGFQHHAIQRDYDFVLIDSFSLLGNGYTLPYGYLREPMQAVRRAHAIVFTKYSKECFQQVENLKNRLLHLNPKLKFFYMYFTPLFLKNSKDQIKELHELKRKSLCVFSGIGNFESLKYTIQNLDPLQVKYLQFPDHYSFSEEEILEMIEQNKDKELICTEKDFVKLTWLQNSPEYEKIYYLVMQTKVEPANILSAEIRKLIPKISLKV